MVGVAVAELDRRRLDDDRLADRPPLLGAPGRRLGGLAHGRQAGGLGGEGARCAGRRGGRGGTARSPRRYGGPPLDRRLLARRGRVEAGDQIEVVRLGLGEVGRGGRSRRQVGRRTDRRPCRALGARWRQVLARRWGVAPGGRERLLEPRRVGERLAVGLDRGAVGRAGADGRAPRPAGRAGRGRAGSVRPVGVGRAVPAAALGLPCRGRRAGSGPAGPRPARASAPAGPRWAAVPRSGAGSGLRDRALVRGRDRRSGRRPARRSACGSGPKWRSAPGRRSGVAVRGRGRARAPRRDVRGHRVVGDRRGRMAPAVVDRRA